MKNPVQWRLSKVDSRHLPLKTTTNFEFIASTMPALYHCASLSEHYYHLDRSGCVAKLRLFAELCVAELLAHYQCAEVEHDETLNEQLNRLSFETSIPSYLVEMLHQLRSAGNLAVHAQRDGRWQTGVIAKNQARELLKAAHELAEFIFVARYHGQSAAIAPWQEPRDPGESYLYQLAFEGDAEACYALAQQLNEPLQLAFAPKQGQRSQHELKSQQQLHDDVQYWLNKSMRQGHWQSQLLAAQLCSGLLNTPAQPEQAEVLFQQALATDEPLVLFHYANFIHTQETGSKWLKLMHRAAAGGLVAATQALIGHYAETGEDSSYQECVELGMAQNDGMAFALRLLALGLEQNPDQQAEKAGRNLMIRAQATGDRAIAFARGFCLYLGRFGYQQDMLQGYQLMREHYRELPSSRFINPAAMTFFAGELYETDSSVRVTQAEQAVKDSVGTEMEAEVAFEVARVLMAHIRDKGSYQGNLVPKVLIGRACELKHQAAIDFVRSQEGKGQLAGMTSVGRPKADRKKLAAKRKAAKRSRRR